VVGMGARAWLRLIDEGLRGGRRDLYQGRFGEIRAPVLLLHGSRDPRTEPGEIEAARGGAPRARLERVDAGHSPHTGSSSAAPATQAALAFLDEALSPRS
jgi:pimeloyl-ACP methyl ester carboxylesterase